MTEDVLHNRSIIALLEKLGLSRNEVKCYLSVLSIGSASVQELAKQSGVHRVNAYGALQVLSERGLVEQEMTRKGRRLHAAPLERLQEYAQQQQKQATKMRWKIEDLIPKLLALTPSGGERPQVMVFEGKDSFTTIAERSLRATSGAEILEIRPESKYETLGAPEHYDEEHYIPIRLERDLKIRVLVPGGWYRKMHPLDRVQNRTMRLLPKGWEIAAETFIYDDEVGFVWKGVEPIGIVIKSAKIATLMRMLFEMAWEMARKKKN